MCDNCNQSLNSTGLVIKTFMERNIRLTDYHLHHIWVQLSLARFLRKNGACSIMHECNKDKLLRIMLPRFCTL